MILAFHKPFGVLSQFTAEASAHRTLSEFGFPPGVYPVGRLDADSEGLLLLSDEAAMVKKLLEPRYEHPREYWVQVEGTVTDEHLKRLQIGVVIREYRTKPCRARHVSQEEYHHIPERTPPIRFRARIPTSWIALELTEGKNRQVRKMTASVGLPTLRLVRVRIGQLKLPTFESGVWQELTAEERRLVLAR